MDSKDSKPSPTLATTNRLIREKSPYLLQHAHNPVDWYPWSEEAFERARELDKPVLVSIGYSSCHWCHVMEEEVFCDAKAARAMNDAFVSIKVDREERPDIDSLYMQVVQLMTGSGGWPLNVVMTPDKRPFFAGTYIPKESRYGRMGMIELADHIERAWKGEGGQGGYGSDEVRAELIKAGEEIIGLLAGAEEGAVGAGGGAGEAETALACEELKEHYDPRNGGVGRAPKFPMAQNITFLLKYHKKTGDEAALEIACMTLKKMRLGGIYDQLGGGFHRYSTDSEWLLPHFEKMLYDQAMLALAYIEGFETTRNPLFKDTAEEIFGYVLSEMTSPEGIFFSAEDADSEGEEGKFYVWQKEELLEVLGEDDAELAARIFSVEAGGNFFDEATGVKTGANVLYLNEEPPEGLKSVRGRLLDARSRRERPFKDDKSLTDWNGLMIAALAKGGWVFDNACYVEAARKAVDFILDSMVDDNGRLFHRYREGEAAIPAFSDDYAFLIFGLIELYEASLEPKYLRAAKELNAAYMEAFWDFKEGGFFLTREGPTDVPVRQKPLMEGALPSGNSVAALNLVRLARLAGDEGLSRCALELFRFVMPRLTSAPSAFTFLLQAVSFLEGPSVEVVVAGEPRAEDTLAMLEEIRSVYLPEKVVLLKSRDNSEELSKLAPYTSALKTREDATAFVCSGFSCAEPIEDPTELRRLLKGE